MRTRTDLADQLPPMIARELLAVLLEERFERSARAELHENLDNSVLTPHLVPTAANDAKRTL